MNHSRSLTVSAVVAGCVVLALGACSPGDGTATPSAQASAAITQDLPAGVNAVECGPASEGRLHAVTVLNGSAFGVGGWNHINGVGQFEHVMLPVRDYRITAENYLQDPTCADAKTLSVVLAKKTWDWDRNHANGMQATFPTDELTFGDVTDVSLVVRIDADRTTIPTADQLAKRYGDYLTADQLAELDNQAVTLELTLFGADATADQPFMNASAMVTIDPGEHADAWVRVHVPREGLTWYTEENYVRTEVGADAHQELLVQGLRINPETSSGLTVRHYLGDSFDPQARAELFKEMALTFALIEIGRAA